MDASIFQRLHQRLNNPGVRINPNPVLTGYQEIRLYHDPVIRTQSVHGSCFLDKLPDHTLDLIPVNDENLAHDLSPVQKKNIPLTRPLFLQGRGR
jgi:hypothetical protein